MGSRHLVVTPKVEPEPLGNPYRADCPTRRILDRIGDRWTVLVVGVLTDAGRTLCEPLHALQDWAIAHLGAVSAAQEAYDRAD
jgi:DNA-binding HxlR family transcriptional regulator